MLTASLRSIPSAQAAEALRPVAGDFAFALFCAGIVGTGLLAVPVLAGSAAYAVAETFKWPTGLGRELFQAKGFYLIVAVATGLGVVLNFTPIDPIKALYWSAVINGVVAAPVMVLIMLMACRPGVMGTVRAVACIAIARMARYGRHGACSTGDAGDCYDPTLNDEWCVRAWMSPALRSLI
jgi:Mn2+/Fe2+ NRAMP family transporter